MLLEGWPKYGRVRQSVNKPKSKCMKRWCWAYCVTTRKHGHLLQKQTNKQLRVFEMGCLRRIMDVTRRDHIKNMDIRANLGITDDIVERIHGQEDYDISVMWSEWINTVCQTLRYMVEWKGSDTEEDPGSPGWIMLLTTAIIEAGASWRLHT